MSFLLRIELDKKLMPSQHKNTPNAPVSSMKIIYCQYPKLVNTNFNQILIELLS